MTNFLIATWEGGGSVTPMLTVARKLADRGHRVRVMSDRCNRPEAEAVGVAFVPWRRAPSRIDRSRESDVFRDWEAETPQEQIGRVLERVWAGPALQYAEDLIEELRREPADLVVSSELLHGRDGRLRGDRAALRRAHLQHQPVRNAGRTARSGPALRPRPRPRRRPSIVRSPPGISRCSTPGCRR